MKSDKRDRESSSFSGSNHNFWLSQSSLFLTLSYPKRKAVKHTLKRAMPFPPRLTIDSSSLGNCRALSDHHIDEKQSTSSLTQGYPALLKPCLQLEQGLWVAAPCRALLCFFTVNSQSVLPKTHQKMLWEDWLWINRVRAASMCHCSSLVKIA